MNLMSKIKEGISNKKMEGIKCDKVVLHCDKKQIVITKPMVLKIVVHGVGVYQVTPRSEKDVVVEDGRNDDSASDCRGVDSVL